MDKIGIRNASHFLSDDEDHNDTTVMMMMNVIMIMMIMTKCFSTESVPKYGAVVSTGG